MAIIKCKSGADQENKNVHVVVVKKSKVNIDK
jgi:hypothetical protein